MPLTGQLIFLGTGTSEGIPRVSCLVNREKPCAVCEDALRPGSPNRRRNVSGLLSWRSGERKYNVLIDCGKSFWEAALAQFPAHDVRFLDALLLTHAHADQMGGLDDLRDITLRMTRGPLPFHISAKDLDVVKRTYPYLFDGISHAKGGGVTNLAPVIFDREPFQVSGLKFQPVPVWHGKDYVSHGFRFGNNLWMGDISAWPEETAWSLAQNLDLLVLDALRPKPHPTHFHLEQSLEFIKKARPKKTFLVDMTHDFEHRATNEELALWGRKEGLEVCLAHDGLALEIELPVS